MKYYQNGQELLLLCNAVSRSSFENVRFFKNKHLITNHFGGNMEKFAKYLAAYDGKAEWSQVEPLFDDLFHPGCVFITAEGKLDKNQWAEMAKGLTAKGARASNFEVTGKEGDSFYYKITITVSDEEPLHLTAKGTVKDGQIIRVEPVDAAVYSKMVERSR
jgi:hypothetical protein